MIEKLAWNTFKKTGNISTYIEFSKLRGLEDELKEKADENIKSKWDNNSRK